MGWNPGRYTGYRERHMNQRSRGGYINLLKFVLCLERPKYIKKKSEVPTWWTSLKEIVGCGSVVSILASNIFIPVQLPPPPPVVRPTFEEQKSIYSINLGWLLLVLLPIFIPPLSMPIAFLPELQCIRETCLQPKMISHVSPHPTHSPTRYSLFIGRHRRRNNGHICHTHRNGRCRWKHIDTREKIEDG